METALARRDFPLVEYAWKFCGLVMRTALDDATLNSLFRFGANYHRRMNLPDITELSWREGILRGLEGVHPRSRTSLSSSPSAVPQSSPPAAAMSSPPAVLFTPSRESARQEDSNLSCCSFNANINNCL